MVHQSIDHASRQPVVNVEVPAPVAERTFVVITIDPDSLRAAKVCANRTFIAARISRFEVTTKRKPFDFFVERLPLKKSRGEGVSFERETQLVSEYVAEAFESNRLDMPLILQATGSADP